MLPIQTYHNSNFPLLKYASNVPCFMQVCAALKDWPDEFLMFFQINHVSLNLQNVLSLVLEVEIPSNFTMNTENAESALYCIPNSCF